jgi:hypothetical protein
MKSTLRSRRGITLVETIVTAAIFVLGAVAMANLGRLGTRSYARADARATVKQVLGRALLRMAPTIRGAFRVDVANSSSTRLALVMPLTDSSGNTIVPLADGRTIAFYLSDTTGAVGAPGTILWRSVNGTPDSSWAMRGGVAQTDLGTAALTFAYTPAASPESVQVTVTAIKWAGNAQISVTASTDSFLRNSRYQ